MTLYAPLPKNYLCKSCDKKGVHWIMDCPTKLHEIQLNPQVSNLRKYNPVEVLNLKMIFKGKNPIALRGKICMGPNLEILEQDDMLKIATWKNDSIFPINKKITTKSIEFPVKIMDHWDKICDDEELFGFRFKFDLYTLTLYIQVNKALPEFFPDSLQEIPYEETCRVLKINQAFKIK